MLLMDAITDFFRSRLGMALAAVVALALVAGAGVFFFMGGASSAESAESAGPVVPEGMISLDDAPTLPSLDQAQPAVEAPSEPVAQVFLPEECAAAADPVRKVMVDYPSGLALDEAGSNRLNEGLAAMSTSCSTEEVAAFQAQELIPWTTYAVPAS